MGSFFLCSSIVQHSNYFLSPTHPAQTQRRCKDTEFVTSGAIMFRLFVTAAHDCIFRRDLSLICRESSASCRSPLGDRASTVNAICRVVMSISLSRCGLSLCGPRFASFVVILWRCPVDLLWRSQPRACFGALIRRPRSPQYRGNLVFKF